jgi:hypothetical protein
VTLRDEQIKHSATDEASHLSPSEYGRSEDRQEAEVINCFGFSVLEGVTFVVTTSGVALSIPGNSTCPEHMKAGHPALRVNHGRGNEFEDSTPARQIMTKTVKQGSDRKRDDLGKFNLLLASGF